MHISDGVLSAPVILTGAGVALAGVGYGLRKLPWDNMMPVALVSSAFFVASLVHVQLGPSSAHLILNGLMGVMLGWAAFPAIAVALFLQAILLQYGGLTALGVNICTVGLPALLVGVVFRRSLRSTRGKKMFITPFFCGVSAVALTAILVAASLACSGEEFYTSAIIVLSAHIPVMLLEGGITVGIYRFIMKVAPEMLSTFSEDS